MRRRLRAVLELLTCPGGHTLQRSARYAGGLWWVEQWRCVVCGHVEDSELVPFAWEGRG